MLGFSSPISALFLQKIPSFSERISAFLLRKHSFQDIHERHGTAYGEGADEEETGHEEEAG